MIDSSILVRYSATLTATEIGLGSMLHTFHIPFSGNFLSLNQGYLLARGVWNNAHLPGVRVLPARVSGVAAILKSLSPAGKRLTPMLAIAAQGFWFSTGTLLFGANAVGILVGMALLCLWPFVQPFLLSYILFGHTWFEALGFSLRLVQKYLALSDRGLVTAFVAVIGVKLIVGMALVWFSRHSNLNFSDRLSEVGFSRLRERVSVARDITAGVAARETLHDLLNPLFLLSVFLIAFFFYFSESAHAFTIWQILRPFALGFVIYFVFRILPERFLPQSARETLRQLRESP